MHEKHNVMLGMAAAPRRYVIIVAREWQSVLCGLNIVCPRSTLENDFSRLQTGISFYEKFFGKGS